MSAPPSETTRTAVRTCRREFEPVADGRRLAFGFDGYIDSVCEMIAEHRGPTDHARLATLERLGERVTASAEQQTSLTIPWDRTGQRLGGHVSHLTRAFGRFGYEPSPVGRFGDPLHEVVAERFGDYDLCSFGDPGLVDAVEFDDGKLMLVDALHVRRTDWDTIRERVPAEEIAAHIDGAAILGIGYWGMMPLLPTIVDGVREDVWPQLDAPPERVLFDPGDLRPLPTETLRDGVPALERLDDVVPVTISANNAETTSLAELFAPDVADATLADRVAVCDEHIDVSRVVGHAIDRAATTGPGGPLTVETPRTHDPELTTSAGDHFNVGLLLGRLQGLDEAASLALGNAVAGWFVRHGEPPSLEAVQEFLETYLDRF